MSLPAVDELLQRVLEGVRAHLAARGRERPLVIGIMTGGVWVAQHVHAGLAAGDPLGSLNIHFYRDDFTRVGLHPRVQPSALPVAVDERHVVLVDDVLYTGRTVRAAMNEIFDYGRPASITLAVLVDRGGRELPVQADVSGARLELGPGETLKLSGPEPLQLLLRRDG